MSDLIEKEDAMDVLDDFQSNVENCVGNAYAIARQQMIAIPSARPKGKWTDVLAELHERFDALEKEIRKASAEMSAIIREYVDRPKGEWILECDAEGEDDNLYRCSECGCNYGCQEYDIPNFCPNCGADMRERKDFQVIVNGNCTKCGKPLSGNRIFICEECEEQSKESE